MGQDLGECAYTLFLSHCLHSRLAPPFTYGETEPHTEFRTTAQVTELVSSDVRCLPYHSLSRSTQIQPFLLGRLTNFFFL